MEIKLIKWMVMLLMLVVTVVVVRADEDEAANDPIDDASTTSSGGGGDTTQSQNTLSFSIIPSGFAVYQDGAANRTLYILGKGFSDKVTLEFDPPLAVGKRVSMSLVNDVKSNPMFGLRLIKGKTWLQKNPQLPYESIYVTKILDASTKEHIYVPEAKIPVARVYPRPELTTKYKPERINAEDTDFAVTGSFFSPKETRLVFNPPLEPRVDYDYSVNEEGTKITLSLKRGKRWRGGSGPLEVVAILGGAGRINLEKPVVVAEVTVNPKSSVEHEFEAITVPDTLEEIYRTYKGTSEVRVKGKGFRSDSPPTIVFKSPGSAIQDEDFELSVISQTELLLTLKKFSPGWMQKPGILTVTELSGEPLGFPVEIANVLETPDIERNRKQLAYESQTPLIVVTGSGFVDGITTIGMLPLLKPDVDYALIVRDATTIEIELLPGKKWPKGPLSVVWIQVGDAKKLYLNIEQPEKGVRVALIEADFAGSISVAASSQRIYQSETGEISVEMMVLPPKFQLKEGEDVPVQVELSSDDGLAIGTTRVTAALSVSESTPATLTMKLLDPSKDRWLDTDGQLHLTSITLPMGDEQKPQAFPLSAGKDKRGVQIARVLPDIRVTYMDPAPIVYMTHSNSIQIRGSGFTYSLGTSFDDEDDSMDADAFDSTRKSTQPVVLDPPLSQDEDFMVIFESSSTIILELIEGKKWRATPGELKLVSLDTGGGAVKINVALGKVALDDPEILCSNDCPNQAAYDGICDDMKADTVTGEFSCYGKDCADCGPRKQGERPTGGKFNKNALCSDTCGESFVKDGICEDGRPGSWLAQCPLCSDCSDCGACREGGYSDMSFCTNGIEGSAAELMPGIPCVFPFTLNGKTYDGSECVKDGRVSGGWGWCPTTDNYARDGKWGSCQYCVDVSSDPSMMEEGMEYYDEEEVATTSKGYKSSGKPKQAKKKHLANSAADQASARGFDFVRWLVNTLFFLVIFSVLGGLFVMVWRRGQGFRYQLVDSKAA